MSQDIQAQLQAQNEETFAKGNTQIISAQFFSNDHGDSIQLALVGIAKRHYIPTRIAWDMLKRFTKKTSLHEEHLEFFAGATAMWAIGRMLVPGVEYTNSKGEEFELKEVNEAGEATQPKLDFIGFNVQFNSREIRSYKDDVDEDCTPASVIYTPELKAKAGAGVDATDLLDEPEVDTIPEAKDIKPADKSGKVDSKAKAKDSAPTFD